MKIWVLSDLHLEFGYIPLSMPASDIDLILIAGDFVTRPNNMTEALKGLRKNTKAEIVLVLGNHEYYGGMLGITLDQYYKACQNVEGVHLLEKEYINFGDTRIYGTTLWTDFRGGLENHNALVSLNDFDLIYRPDGHTITPPNIIEEHRLCLRFLKKNLRKNHKDIVITHHGPSFAGVAPMFRNSNINGCFFCDLDKFILDRQPILWIHGHTHIPVDLKIGRTRVLANPRGYPDEKNSEFCPNLVLEVL